GSLPALKASRYMSATRYEGARRGMRTAAVGRLPTAAVRCASAVREDLVELLQVGVAVGRGHVGVVREGRHLAGGREALGCRSVGADGAPEVARRDLVVGQRRGPVHERPGGLGVGSAGDDAHGVEAQAGAFARVYGGDGPALADELSDVGLAGDAE